MKRSRIFLRLAAIVAVGACGTNEPMPPGSAGGSGGAGGAAPTGTGGSASGGSGGSTTGGMGGTAGAGGSGGSGGMSGSGGSGGVGGGPVAAGDYFPFKAGNRWVYQVTEGGGAIPPYRKENVIVRMEAVGGNGPNKDKMAFRVETRKFAAGSTTAVEDATISWQVREGARVVRYRETSCTRLSAVFMNGSVSSCNTDVEDYWNPGRVRIDERPMGMDPAKGMTWPEVYQEYKNTYDWTVMPPRVVPSGPVMHTDTWTITDANVSVTVPAGTFNTCMVITKKTFLTQMVKTYTFCKGVGKVKEVGLGQTEDLAEMPTLN